MVLDPKLGQYGASIATPFFVAKKKLRPLFPLGSSSSIIRCQAPARPTPAQEPSCRIHWHRRTFAIHVWTLVMSIGYRYGSKLPTSTPDQWMVKPSYCAFVGFQSILTHTRMLDRHIGGTVVCSVFDGRGLLRV